MVSDNAVVVDVDGLPDDPVAISMDLTSTSGRTHFKVGDGLCTVLAERPDHAECVVSGGIGGTGLSALGRRATRAAVPLDFPDDLETDRLKVSVGLNGYAESNPSDNERELDFQPTRSTDGPTEDPTPTDDPTPDDAPPPAEEPAPTDQPTPADEPSTPAPPASRDLSVDLGSVDDGAGIGRFRAVVSNLPTDGTSAFRLDVSFSDGRVDLEGIPAGCRYLDGGRTALGCSGAGAFSGVLDADLRRIGPGQQVTVTVKVSMADVVDPVPGNDAASLTLVRAAGASTSTAAARQQSARTSAAGTRHREHRPRTRHHGTRA